MDEKAVKKCSQDFNFVLNSLSSDAKHYGWYWYRTRIPSYIGMQLLMEVGSRILLIALINGWIKCRSILIVVNINHHHSQHENL